MPKPSISDARWAESVKIAIEPARYPPISYAVMKKIETIDTVSSFFFAALVLSFYTTRRASKFIGDLTGIGVPKTSSWGLSATLLNFSSYLGETIIGSINTNSEQAKEL